MSGDVDRLLLRAPRPTALFFWGGAGSQLDSLSLNTWSNMVFFAV
jgi:hypothetical protein